MNCNIFASIMAISSVFVSILAYTNILATISLSGYKYIMSIFIGSSIQLASIII